MDLGVKQVLDLGVRQDLDLGVKQVLDLGVNKYYQIHLLNQQLCINLNKIRVKNIFSAKMWIIVNFIIC